MRELRWYRAMLRLLPRSFRERHGQEMQLVFAEHLEARSSMGRVLASAAAGWDVIRQAIRLRLRPGRAPRPNPWHPGRAPRPDGTTLQDAAFAVRALARRPAFSGVAVLVLALGIGSTVTVYSAVQGIVIRPLPYADANRLGILWHEFGQGGQSGPRLNALDLFDYRAWSEAFEGFTLATSLPAVVGGPDDAVADVVVEVEAGLFEFLGIQPLHGRTVVPEEDVPGAAPVALLSHRIWLGRFGATPDAIGQSIDVDGEPHRIIGVLPADFRIHLSPGSIIPQDPAVWRALRFDADEAPARNVTRWVAFGRVKPGLTFEQAGEDLARMAERLRTLHPEHAAAETRARIVPLKQHAVGHVASSLILLLGAVTLVLLVACANVANLLVTRVRSREAELAIRNALGASRARIARLVLLESLILAVGGGAAGVGLALGGLEAIRALGGGSLPRLESISVDNGVLAFALLLSLLAALAAGLAPAVGAASGSPARMIAGHGRASPGRHRVRLRDGVVVFEMSLSLALLVGTGLLLRTLWSLQDVDPGFATEGVVTVPLYIQSAVPTAEGRLAFMREVTERVAARPDVASVGIVSHRPFSGMAIHRPYAYDEETTANWERVTAESWRVLPGYFESIGAKLQSGRDFAWTDFADLQSSYAIVIDDRLAARAFPEGGAVGKTLQTHVSGFRSEVIGVVSHLLVQDLTAPGREQMFFLNRGTGIEGGRPVLVIRTDLPATTVEGVVREEVSALASGVAFGDVKTVEQITAGARAQTRALAVLLTAFGVIALVVAAVGLYGVLSFNVRQRTQEIGVRMALGQSPLHIQRVVFMRGANLLGVSLALGLLAAALGGRLAQSFLFGVGPLDPPTYVTVVCVLGGAALLASWLPARQATRVDPIEALKPD